MNNTPINVHKKRIGRTNSKKTGKSKKFMQKWLAELHAKPKVVSKIPPYKPRAPKLQDNTKESSFTLFSFCVRFIQFVSDFLALKNKKKIKSVLQTKPLTMITLIYKQIFVNEKKMRILKNHPLISLANGYIVDSPQPSKLSYL